MYNVASKMYISWIFVEKKLSTLDKKKSNYSVVHKQYINGFHVLKTYKRNSVFGKKRKVCKEADVICVLLCICFIIKKNFFPLAI